MRLRRTRYYLYYRVDNDLIEIVALWHMSRGTPPPI
jgi:hypothetical protein